MTDLESARPYTVVVGVSSTSKSPTALIWAQSQARNLGGRLIAVRTWRIPSPPTIASGSPDAAEVAVANYMPAEEREERASRALEADVAEVLGEGHGAEVRLVRGGRRKGLLRAAADADLLVVDAPRELAAAPFAHRLMYRASCPVVVMPPRVTSGGSSVTE